MCRSSRRSHALQRLGISVLLAVTGLLIAIPSVAAHEPSIPRLPANTGCDEFVVLVKASVTEDRAAANMLAEALRIRSGDRCLLDAYDSVAVNEQIDSAAVSAERQVVFVVGGSAAISDETIMNLGIDRVIRVSERIAGRPRGRSHGSSGISAKTRSTGPRSPESKSTPVRGPESRTRQKRSTGTGVVGAPNLTASQDNRAPRQASQANLDSSSPAAQIRLVHNFHEPSNGRVEPHRLGTRSRASAADLRAVARGGAGGAVTIAKRTGNNLCGHCISVNPTR